METSSNEASLPTSDSDEHDSDSYTNEAPIASTNESDYYSGPTKVCRVALTQPPCPRTGVNQSPNELNINSNGNNNNNNNNSDPMKQSLLADYWNELNREISLLDTTGQWILIVYLTLLVMIVLY
ncbi:hypothetical protein BLOT_005164 [Blomia tropicalis]|nr:hypothetical protein BLOT_005164 [Blomia tropicalis]